MSRQLNVGEPAASLSARTSTGTGESFGVPNGLLGQDRIIGWEITYAVVPATISVALQGSIDEVTWYDLDTHTLTTPLLKFVVDKVVKFLRANLSTLTGASASVNVNILI